MSGNTIYANYYEENSNSVNEQNLQFNCFYAPTDHWSSGDRALLGTALALGALLAAAGALGILGNLGRNVGPFNVISAKFGMTSSSLAAFGGGGLLLVTLATASVKNIQDARRTAQISKLFTDRQSNGQTPLAMAHVIDNENACAYGQIQDYHVVYHKSALYLFATEKGAKRKLGLLENQKQKRYENIKKPEDIEKPTSSMMNKFVTYYKWTFYTDTTLSWDAASQSYKTKKKTHFIQSRYNDYTKNRVPRAHFRITLGVLILAGSITAFVLPFFMNYHLSQPFQLAGLGAGMVMLYGVASGLLLKKRSKEFVTKGHNSNYRKVNGGIAYGLSRNILNAIFLGGLLAVAGCTLNSAVIRPLYLAAPLGLGAVTLLAYTHFKGKERERRWNEGIRRDLTSRYREGEPLFFSSPSESQTFTNYNQLENGKDRYVLSNHPIRSYKRLIIDLADIENIPAFEGAKKQYNLSNQLLPLLALVLIIALVGTRIFFWRLPPRPV